MAKKKEEAGDVSEPKPVRYARGGMEWQPKPKKDKHGHYCKCGDARISGDSESDVAAKVAAYAAAHGWQRV